MLPADNTPTAASGSCRSIVAIVSHLIFSTGTALYLISYVRLVRVGGWEVMWGGAGRVGGGGWGC